MCNVTDNSFLLSEISYIFVIIKQESWLFKNKGHKYLPMIHPYLIEIPLLRGSYFNLQKNSLPYCSIDGNEQQKKK